MRTESEHDIRRQARTPFATARPPRVVALVTDASSREAIRAELAELASVEFCTSARELFRLASDRKTALVFTEPRDAAGRRTAPVLQSLAVISPRVQVVIYLELSVRDVRDALERWASGVIVRGREQIAPTLRTALARAPRIGSPGRVLEGTAALVPPEVRRFFIHCAWRASRLATAREAAAGLRIPYRTLAVQLAMAALPSPKEVLSWYRLLHAAWHMELSHSSRERVAADTGFSSGAKLAATLRRHADISWTELRERVGFNGLLESFEERIGTRAQRTRGSSASESPKRSHPE